MTIMSIINSHKVLPHWSVALAKQKLSALLKAAIHEPQVIFNRNQPVAVVVPYGEFLALQESLAGKSLFESFAELRKLVKDERYDLEVPKRRNRKLY